MPTNDHYEALEITPDADQEAVKAAYRALALTFHPDRNPGFVDEAAERMKALTAAFEVLGNPGRRAAYDSERLAASGPKATASSGEPRRGGPDGTGRAMSHPARVERIVNLAGARGAGKW